MVVDVFFLHQYGGGMGRLYRYFYNLSVTSLLRLVALLARGLGGGGALHSPPSATERCSVSHSSACRTHNDSDLKTVRRIRVLILNHNRDTLFHRLRS